jgi:uncharacterized protein (DUF2147 family)
MESRETPRELDGTYPRAGRTRIREDTAMRSLLILVALAIANAILLSETSGWATSAAIRFDPTGEWWAEGGSAQVQIQHCDDGLCGRVVWLRHPHDTEGCGVSDEQNPDPALRSRPIEGLQVIGGLTLDGDASAQTWSGGWIYDPTSGRTYSASVRMRDPNRLDLRGYMGFELIGRTSRWIRVGSENECGSPLS